MTEEDVSERSDAWQIKGKAESTQRRGFCPVLKSRPAVAWVHTQ